MNNAPKSKKTDLFFCNQLYLAMNLSSSLLAKKRIILFPTRQIYVNMANDTDGQLTEDILLEKQYCSNASIDIYCNVTST